MRIVLQRVLSASVEVDGKIVGEIGPGLMLFLGFGREDSSEVIPLALRKVLEMRVFSDDKGKMNRCVKDIDGSILAISQFTLYANNSRGRRPDFT
ncbi:MAG: D-aminoacyl-tRNA deacylase, partial [Candidatus Cloacimonadaceae bacterium]|nr:D-aminoacyl-tRNA deacylase [Candidatus Cloacimonadaceae bacterium]